MTGSNRDVALPPKRHPSAIRNVPTLLRLDVPSRSSRASVDSYFRIAIGVSLGRAPVPAFERMIERVVWQQPKKPRDR